MGEAEELRYEIEGTRDHLGATMVAIEEHVSPRAMVQRRRSAMAERWASLRESVMGKASDMTSSASDAAQGAPTAAVHQAQGNPLAAGLVAFQPSARAALGIAAVVRKQHDERVVQLAALFEPRDKRTDAAVQSVDHRGIDRHDVVKAVLPPIGTRVPCPHIGRPLG